jgi:hypothetical protein
VSVVLLGSQAVAVHLPAMADWMGLVVAVEAAEPHPAVADWMDPIAAVAAERLHLTA